MKFPGIAALLAIAGALGCSSSGPAADDPVSRLFENHYQEFVASAGAHHAGCDVAIRAKGDAGSKRDALTTSVDVDAQGGYRLVREDGSELIHVGLHAWSKSRDGKVEPRESGARSDLERDAAVAEWRTVLEPLRDRVRLKKTGSKKLGTRAVETWDLTLEPGGDKSGPKVEKGSGKLETDVQTGFPVRMELTASWSADAPGGAQGRVNFEIEKMGCAVTELGKVQKVDAPGETKATPVEATPTPAAKPSPKSTKKTR